MKRFARGQCVEVAVVGLGYWGPNRVRVLGDLDDVEIAWICDLDQERLRQVSERHPSAKRTRRIEDILADASVDAVVIATPVFSHADLASAALRAGKHVFVEKPLAASSGEALQLGWLAEECERALVCGHTFLHSPPVRLVKEILDRGELGELHYISSSRVNLGPYRSDVSVVFDLGPHDFSILQYWVGEPPRSVSAIGSDVISPGVSDFAFINATYGNGLLANVELSWLAPSKLRRTVLVGSERMLVYEDGSPEPVRIYDSGIEYRDPETFGEYHLAYRTGDIVSPRIDTAEPIAVEMVEFVRTVRGERDSRDDRNLAVDVIRVVEAAEASIGRGGASVAVGVSDRGVVGVDVA